MYLANPRSDVGWATTNGEDVGGDFSKVWEISGTVQHKVVDLDQYSMPPEPMNKQKSKYWHICIDLG